ncbi:hypothetical protein ACFOTA_05330 [Chitinophaga sp. GCM10012297]|uniref:Uncharacterized protein n=1 Tax=Chitinophaga chungangae TaxID=2821488 RepID=A0ABS3YAB5_9BACT|nr:hypothetical protein [Chitinophaga chungangae]MBO9151617.1 hypothetical protein [Chitinophaga chungangae]
MKYLFKPYSLFLYVALIFLAVYVFYDNHLIDIQIGGTYYDLLKTGRRCRIAANFTWQ